MAAGMPWADFKAWSDSPAPPSQVDFPSLPLTLLLLLQPIRPHDSIDARLEFDFNRETPSPGAMTKAMKCDIDGAEWASILPPDCITSLEIPIVEKDVAHGTVAVKSDRNWRGQVHFSMRKSDGKWQVVEFRLPVNAIGTRRTKDNSWERITLDGNDGVRPQNPAHFDSESSQLPSAK